MRVPLRPLFPLSVLGLSLALVCAAPARARAEAIGRPFGAAAGAVMGGIVGGPVGLVAGAVIGYALTPVVTGDLPRKVARRRVVRRRVAAAPQPVNPQQAYYPMQMQTGQPVYMAPQAYGYAPQQAYPVQQPYAQAPTAAQAYPQAAPAVSPAQAYTPQAYTPQAYTPQAYTPQAYQQPMQPPAQPGAAAQRPPVYAAVPTPLNLPPIGNYATRAYQPPDNSQSAEPLH